MEQELSALIDWAVGRIFEKTKEDYRKGGSALFVVHNTPRQEARYFSNEVIRRVVDRQKNRQTPAYNFKYIPISRDTSYRSLLDYALKKKQEGKNPVLIVLDEENVLGKPIPEVNLICYLDVPGLLASNPAQRA